jgi:cathepsin F
VQQQDHGVINVLNNPIQCIYLQSRPLQENVQEREVIENIEKQIINQSISLDHEVQTSADHNDRPFIAVRATQSEYCPGCPYELNPTLSGLSAFRDQVLQSMDEAGVSDFKHKLISIIRVTRSVPPGLSAVQYQLLMEIGESNCLRTSLIEVSECTLQSNLPIKLCLVTFVENPWQINSRKITKNNCTDLLNTDNEVSASVDPNSLLIQSASLHKEDDVSTKTEFYDQIAQEAQEVVRVPSMDIATKESIEATVETESAKELPLTKVITLKAKETEQSSKFSDKIKEFDEFLEDFNGPINPGTTNPQNFDKTIVETKSAEEKYVQQSENPVLNPTVRSIRSKRSTKALESNKSIIRKLAIKAVELLDSLNNNDKRKRVIDILDSKREKQYHGIIYYITVEVAPTDCNKKDNSTECLDEVILGPTQICKFDIATNEKKPLQSPNLLHHSCQNKQKSEMRFKRQMVGSPRPYDVNDPKVQEYVHLGLQKYSEGYSGTNQPMINNVKEVTVQVVSGLLYKIKVDIGVSTCPKGSKQNCQLKSDEKIKECIIEVWSQPWIDKGHPQVTVKCDENRRKKRSLRGRNYNLQMLKLSRQLKEEKLFHEFINKFDKNYDTQEEKERRFKIFKKNLDIIEELQRNEQGTGIYGVTQFTDLTKAEFKDKYLGLKQSLKSDNDIPLPKAVIPDIELPVEYDWRHYNAVTPVKDQGQCGSCWAFSVTGNIEGQYAIKYGKLLSLSEQELIDCDKFDKGCNGGLFDTAYRAIEELGGLEGESDYPYQARNKKCNLNKNKIEVNVVSGLNISTNEVQMAQWLVHSGPMSIGINANAMMFYVGGVSHPYKFLCNPDDIDHGVLIVGYGLKCM